MGFRPRSLLATLLVLALSGFAGPAAAQTESLAQQAAVSLQESPVYIHPNADPSLTQDEVDELIEAIRTAGAGAIYVAVLPDGAENEAGGSLDALAENIHDDVGEEGTYVVVSGNTLRAGSDNFEAGVVPSLADEAIAQSGSEGLPAILLTLVSSLGEAAQGGSTGSGEEPAGESSGGDFGGLLLVLLLVVGLLLVMVSGARRRRREAAERQRQLEEVKQVALDDLVALGEDIRALEIDVEMPGAPAGAKTDLQQAVGSYSRASDQLDRSARVEEIEPVTSAIEEGRYAMASARARLDGREPPERRPPCFFDPRHGPSSRDVQWAPPGGALRDVPACEADAITVDEGADPAARQVVVQGQEMPFYNAPSYFYPWMGGYFGMFGTGLLPGMLLGSMIGGPMGFGFGFGGYGYGGDAGGGGEGGDGGGFGDFGGGDFGGGGFGGGDFGGGDFGGGDF